MVDDEWTADPVEVNLVGQPEATTGWDVKVEQLTSSSPETFTPIDAGVDGTTVNLSSDGVFRVTYTRGDDAVLIRTIRIDATAPTVTFADVQVVFPGEPVQPASPVCTDVPAPGAVESSGLAGDCVITSAPGEATTAIATDAVGNTSEPQTQTLVTVSGDGYSVTSEWFNGGTAAPVVIVTTTGSDPVVTTVNGTPITGPITGDGIFTVDVELDGVSLIEPFEIKIDGTDPVIGTAGLALSFTVGQTPGLVSCAATDATSGLAGTCQVTTTIDTSTATTGPVPIIARAVDVAGNATTAQIGTYTVTAAYVASGYFPGRPPTTYTKPWWNKNPTVPIKPGLSTYPSSVTGSAPNTDVVRITVTGLNSANSTTFCNSSDAGAGTWTGSRSVKSATFVQSGIRYYEVSWPVKTFESGCYRVQSQVVTAGGAPLSNIVTTYIRIT